MPYKIKNLLKVSRKAPLQGKTKSDKVLQQAFTRLFIGRVIHVGRSATISDEVFAANKERIEHLESVGAITVENLSGKPAVKDSGAKEAPKVAPAPKKVVAAKAEPAKEAPKEEAKKEPVKPAPVKMMEPAPVKAAPKTKTTPAKAAPAEPRAPKKAAPKRKASAAKAKKDS